MKWVNVEEGDIVVFNAKIFESLTIVECTPCPPNSHIYTEEGAIWVAKIWPTNDINSSWLIPEHEDKVNELIVLKIIKNNECLNKTELIEKIKDEFIEYLI